MSIIGISGAQGQGKSTTISGVVEQSDNVRYLDIQTARETLNEWGYTLAEVNAYSPLKIRFQEELYRRHCACLDQVYDDSSEVYLVERTFADIFNYALVSIGPFNDHSKWLNEYALKCRDAQVKYFDKVVFLSGREYTPEDDGVRSVNVHFSNLTNFLILYYTKAFHAEKSDAVIHIQTPSLEERIETLRELCSN